MAEPAVVILGGGPAGCASAIALRQSGIETVLLEGGAYTADRIGESIPPDTRLLFERLGIREAFEQEGHEACVGSCSSWGDDALGYNDFAFNPSGAGFHLDRRRFEIFMARQALNAGVRLITRARFRQAWPCGPKGAGYIVELETSGGVRRVKASFVIDAMGSGAHFARKCGAERLMHDHFFSISGCFQLRAGAGFQQLTMLEAVPNGWWYAARLPDQRIAVAFACEGDELKAVSLHVDSSWLKQLSRTSHLAVSLVDCFFIPGSLRVCPVPCFVLDRSTGTRWLAAGDAASSFDPLSAQGIYKALANGLSAADTVRAVLAGSEHELESYADGIRQAFTVHVTQRDAFYEREQRWLGSDFWLRRRTVRRIPSALSPTAGI